MANRIPRRPPRYTGNDPDKKAVFEYLDYLYQTMDYHLGEIYKRLEKNTAAEEE